jgi:hypothetical protein
MRYWVIKMRKDDNDPGAWLRRGAMASDGSNHPLKSQRPDAGDRCFYWQRSSTPRLIGLGQIQKMRSSAQYHVIADVRAETGEFRNPLTIHELRSIPRLQEKTFLKGGYPATFYSLDVETAQLLYQLSVASTPLYTDVWKDLPQTSSVARAAWKSIQRLRGQLSKASRVKRTAIRDKVQLMARLTRAGQPNFRRTLRDATGGRCEVTGSLVLAVLDACHIHPHSGGGSYDPTNGVLLRTDVHALLDAGLMGIHPHTLKITCSKELAGSDYWKFHGRTLIKRLDGSRPDERALKKYWGALA